VVAGQAWQAKPYLRVYCLDVLQYFVILSLRLMIAMLAFLRGSRQSPQVGTAADFGRVFFRVELNLNTTRPASSATRPPPLLHNLLMTTYNFPSTPSAPSSTYNFPPTPSAPGINRECSTNNARAHGPQPQYHDTRQGPAMTPPDYMPHHSDSVRHTQREYCTHHSNAFNTCGLT